MNDVKITIWEAEPISDLQQDSDSQRATVQQHIYPGELSRSYAEQPARRESRAVTGIQLEEKQVNTEFNRSQEKILAWPRMSQCCSGNWTFCWRLECEAGRYCVYCPSRTSGSAPGVEDAQLDRNNLPEGLMTSKKREFLICSGGRRRLTPTRLTQENVSVPLERCAQHFIVIMYVSVVSDWLEITSPSSVWISGPCCWWFDEQNNTQCKNEEKGSLLIFSCKMLLQTQTHSD